MKLTCVSAAVTLIWLDEKKLPLEIEKANSFSKCENLIIMIETPVDLLILCFLLVSSRMLRMLNILGYTFGKTIGSNCKCLKS